MGPKHGFGAGGESHPSRHPSHLSSLASLQRPRNQLVTLFEQAMEAHPRKAEAKELAHLRGHLAIWARKLRDHAFLVDGRIASEIFHTFFQLHRKPPEGVGEKLFDLATATIAHHEPRTLASIMHSGSSLALIPPDHFLQEIQYRLPKFLQRFTTKEAYKFLHSLTMTDAVGEHFQGSERFPAVEIYKQAAGHPHFAKTVLFPKNIEQQGILADAVYWFSGKSHVSRVCEDDKKSKFEEDLARTLLEAGAKRLEDTVLPRSSHRFDATFMAGDRTFYVEGDGPTHLVKSGNGLCWHFNGNTILQTALLYREIDRNHAILRVPKELFTEKKADKRLWESVVNKIADGKTGALTIDETGRLISFGQPNGRHCCNRHNHHTLSHPA